MTILSFDTQSPNIKNAQQPKTILITGASRGLGKALAQALAHDGHSLILDARGAEALNQTADALRTATPHSRILALAGDVADPLHQEALAQAARELGGLDAIVLNASLLGPSPQPALLDYPIDVLERVFRVNVFAPLALLQVLKGQIHRDARVLAISSDAGREAYAGWGGYGASKAALEQLAAVLAQEQPDWKVYGIDPGDMHTQMHQEAFPGEDISDRPEPETSVPGLLSLLTGDWPSGAYAAREARLNSGADAREPVAEGREVLV